MRSKVYISQAPIPNKSSGWVPDLSSLNEYGELEPILSAGFDAAENFNEAKLVAQRKLEHFDYELDFFCPLVLTSPIAAMVCSNELYRLNTPYINVLYWKPIRKKYLLLRMELG